MKRELNLFDIYPKVVKTNTPTKIHIKSCWRLPFEEGREYDITFDPICQGHPMTYPENTEGRGQLKVTPNEKGIIEFEYNFPLECEYYLRIFLGNHEAYLLNLYAVNDDLAGRIPRIGDLHIHSLRSDGGELPAVVAANFRKKGYDFLAITDHRRYYPSLEAIDAYKDVEHTLTMVPGEELHLPSCDIHIVNFGGQYSVNALIENFTDPKEVYVGATPPEISDEENEAYVLPHRAVDMSKCPKQITLEEYHRQVQEIADSIDVPKGVNKLMYARCLWAYDRVREADGMSIFAHPYWITNVFQVPEAFTDYMLGQHPFDAFEVLGGKTYYEKNGFQTAKYYNDLRLGRDYPIVGSTDNHNSDTKSTARTMVFPEANTRECLISAIKDKYSVALDYILSEPRVVGSFRLIKYAWFLLQEYFPLKDAIAAEDGRAMMRYYIADTEEEKAYYARRMAECKAEVEAMEKKYFAI